jgi:hypothetical protein
MRCAPLFASLKKLRARNHAMRDALFTELLAAAIEFNDKVNVWASDRERLQAAIAACKKGGK